MLQTFLLRVWQLLSKTSSVRKSVKPIRRDNQEASSIAPGQHVQTAADRMARAPLTSIVVDDVGQGILLRGI